MIVSFVQRPSGLLQSGTFQLRTRGILQNPCQVEKNEAVHAKKTVCETGMAAGGSRRGENSKEFFGKRRARPGEKPGDSEESRTFLGETGRSRGGCRAIPGENWTRLGKPGASMHRQQPAAATARGISRNFLGKAGAAERKQTPKCAGSSRRQKKRGVLTQHGETAPCPAGPF